MLSLFDSTGYANRPVTFQVEGQSNALVVSIASVEREDGSGENWNFKGCDGTHNPVRGHYNTKRRRGHMEIMRR